MKREHGYEEYFGRRYSDELFAPLVNKMESFLKSHSVTPAGIASPEKPIQISVAKLQRTAAYQETLLANYISPDGHILAQLVFGLSFERHKGSALDISLSAAEAFNAKTKSNVAFLHERGKEIFDGRMGWEFQEAVKYSRDGKKNRFELVGPQHFRTTNFTHFEDLPLRSIANALDHFRYDVSHLSGSNGDDSSPESDPNDDNPTPSAPAMALRIA